MNWARWWWWRRPGDYLKPNEPDLLGLQSRLHLRLGPADSHLHSDVEEEGVNEAGIPEGAKEWEIKECLAQFWRPNFEGFMVCPYSLSPALRMADVIVAMR